MQFLTKLKNSKNDSLRKFQTVKEINRNDSNILVPDRKGTCTRNTKGNMELITDHFKRQS